MKKKTCESKKKKRAYIVMVAVEAQFVVAVEVLVEFAVAVLVEFAVVVAALVERRARK